MAHVLPPFRADVVGSFLRPQAVHEARAAFEAGKIDRAALTRVEDEAIAELIKKEVANGLQAVTDGEFRRALWHMDFFGGLTGATLTRHQATADALYQGNEPSKKLQLSITGPLSFPQDHPFLAHFDALKRIAKEQGVTAVLKQTIPASSVFHLIAVVRNGGANLPEVYRDEDRLFADIAKTWTDAMLAFYAHGCRYLQFDDTSWGELCSQEKRALYAERGLDVDALGRRYVEVLNEILSHKPADMTVTMHICRGNFRSTWFVSGGYDPVAPIVFAHCKVDGFFLEYDSDRSGGFAPLAQIKDQTVVLGLVTSKFPKLEKSEDIKARIAEATKYVPLEQLCLSPQCGFASTEEGNKLTEDEQWAKIRLIRSIADEVWQGK